MRLSQIQKSSRRKTASPWGIQIRERRVNWIKDGQLNTVLFQRFWGVCSHRKQFDQCLYVHVERQGKLVRIHKNICRTDTDYSALHALTAGVVLESYFAVWQHPSLRSLPGGREFVATGGGDSRGGCMFEKGGAGFSWACSFDEQSALHEKSDNYSWYETKPLIRLISPILDSNAQVQIYTMLLYAVCST